MPFPAESTLHCDALESRAALELSNFFKIEMLQLQMAKNLNLPGLSPLGLLLFCASLGDSDVDCVFLHKSDDIMQLTTKYRFKQRYYIQYSGAIIEKNV